jgi:hypothetical protein
MRDVIAGTLRASARTDNAAVRVRRPPIFVEHRGDVVDLRDQFVDLGEPITHAAGT